MFSLISFIHRQVYILDIKKNMWPGGFLCHTNILNIKDSEDTLAGKDTVIAHLIKLIGLVETRF